jgi:crossover junction endodeoxyribonuclease RuvC
MGIDPGKTGAFAFIDEEMKYEVFDFPDDPGEVVSELITRNVQWAALEKVGAMPGQGVTSMFSFGTNYGIWQGILYSLKISFDLVTPATWQKGIVFQSDGKDPKERALTAARRMFPLAELDRKKDHGRADALLMALWCRKNRA